MIVSENVLFHQIALSDFLQWQLNHAQNEVDLVSKDQFLANSDDQVIDYIFAKMESVPLAIFREKVMLSEPKEIRMTYRDPLERETTIAGVLIELSVSYTGESNLWRMMPSRYSTSFPKGDHSPVDGNDHAGFLRFKLQFPQKEYQIDKVKNEIDRNIQSIEEYLGYIKQDIEAHNPMLQNKIKRQVSERRERLGIIQSVTEILNIPIQTRDGVPNLSEIPLQKKIIEPLKTLQNSTQEYGIGSQKFEDVLSIIRHMGGTFERTPQTYSVHDEEQLRDILLASLNAYFQGLATGEAFRKKGKTDICIEFKSRAAFVAECKLWKGDQKLLEAVNQLLGYLTWRDCKTALVIFNKDVAGFAQVQGKMREILRHQSNFVRDETDQDNSEWRIVFRSLEDPDRMVTVHIFLFNLFVSKS